ncbi:MAG TPA: hypothetical protein VEA38_04380 [Terriglobales bacterium]|nr:hypothetical protein [Terriglobales bacterium]
MREDRLVDDARVTVVVDDEEVETEQRAAAGLGLFEAVHQKQYPILVTRFGRFRHATRENIFPGVPNFARGARGLDYRA